MKPKAPPGRGRIVHLLAAATISFNAAGNCMLRVGLKSLGPTFSISGYLAALGNFWVILGVVVLFGWLILQLSLLSWADLSYVLPVTSASYVVIALAGAIALHEHVSAVHWLGVLLILAGVLVVGPTKPLTLRHGKR